MYSERLTERQVQPSCASGSGYSSLSPRLQHDILHDDLVPFSRSVSVMVQPRLAAIKCRSWLTIFDRP
nr:hypothetical protein CFP56_48792 [Quercus suber]